MTYKHLVTASWMGLSWALSVPAPAASFTLTVKDVPVPGLVWCKPGKPLDPKAVYALDDAGQTIPAQLDDAGRLWWHQSKLCDATNPCVYTLKSVATTGEGGVKVEPSTGDVINVTVDGKPFTTFNYGKDLPKPFLYPVLGPAGAVVTRHFPMKEVDAEPKARRDHPHHRSIWTAHGDVRLGDPNKKGTDYWAQTNETGIQRVTRIVRATGGPVFGVIEADIDWVTVAGKKELSETRMYRFYKDADDARVIDVKVAFKFTEGDVLFGDTKEGGMVSLRVATTMDEQTAGKMFNSLGQVGEKECWGKPAEWCDYVGPVANQTIGIAVMDAKTNYHHPVSWHIRAYGLYTANPFGLKAFGQREDGSHAWKKGETAQFDYRILIHKGDTKAAKVAERYHLFTDGVEVTVK